MKALRYFHLLPIAFVLLFTVSSFAQTPTSTKTLLFFSPSTTVTAGTVLTVSATVDASGTPVHPGQVLFCNADAPRCEGSAILGQAQLPANGKASVHIRFGVGAYNIKAVFPGILHTSAQSPILRAASSSVPQLLTIKPKAVQTFPKTFTLTMISASGGPSTYNFTGTVTAINGPPPQGNVAFEDVTNGTTIGTVPLTQGTKAVSLGYLGALSIMKNAEAASADFNRDGIPDVALVYGSGGSLTVSLGRGDGTVISNSTFQFGNIGGALTIADFNSDGIPDLAVGDTSSGSAPCCSASILLGKGDGTFALQSQFPIGHGNLSLASADFDGDGIPDLAVINHDDSTLTIALGAGDCSGRWRWQLRYSADNCAGWRAGGSYHRRFQWRRIAGSGGSGQSERRCIQQRHSAAGQRRWELCRQLRPIDRLAGLRHCRERS
jgi:hypothetical protein